jgi:transposase
MNQGMLLVWEDADQLCELMKQQSNSLLRTRLHMLYLLRVGAAANRTQVARLLGVARETVGDWLRLYERGGLPALLRRGQAKGAASSLPSHVQAGMRAQLAQPRGLASFRELHRWVEQTYQIQTTYRVVHYTATQVLGARLAVGRRSHIKKKRRMRGCSAPRWNTGCARPHSPLNRSVGASNCSPCRSSTNCLGRHSPCGFGHRTKVASA